METQKALSAPIGMRYRKLKEKGSKNLVVQCSTIHGRGLFTKQDIEKGGMIIEYAGEVFICSLLIDDNTTTIYTNFN